MATFENHFETGSICNQIQGDQINNYTIENAYMTNQQEVGKAIVAHEEKTSTEEEFRDGTIDEHKLAFRDAMLKVQECAYSQLPLEGMIKNVYDWYAVMRLGTDLGIISDGWAGITAIFATDKRFREVPKDYRNFSPYVKYISKNFKYPDWQCIEKEQSYFRKFLEIANLTYSLYKTICQKEKIKPYL